MKKFWKTAWRILLMSCILTVCFSTQVFAETLSGEVGEGFTWTLDMETGILELKGEGKFPDDYSDPDLDAWPWRNFEDSIKKVKLDYNLIFSSYASENYFNELVDTIFCDVGQGFYWEYDVPSDTVTFKGKGAWPENLHIYRHCQRLVVGDDITSISNLGRVEIFLGKNVKISGPEYLVDYTNKIEVSSDNPYYSVYDDCLYNKDYSKLLSCPDDKQTVKYHPNVKIIGFAATPDFPTTPYIIPWGVTEIEKGAFASIALEAFTVVLPDTLTSMSGEGLWHRNSGWVFIFSEKNTVAKSSIKAESYGDQSAIIPRMVPSVREYYPDVPDSEFTKPASGPSEGSSQKAESKPVTETPSSVPSSKPAVESKPSVSVSQSSSAKASSSPSTEESSAPSTVETESSVPIVSENSESSAASAASVPIAGTDSGMEDESSQDSSVEAEGVNKDHNMVFIWVVIAILAVGAAGIAVFCFKRKKRE